MRVIGLSLSKELAIQANGIYNFDALGIGAKLDSKTLAFQIRSPNKSATKKRERAVYSR